MKKLILATVMLLTTTAFCQYESVKYQGEKFDGYRVLISSKGICPEGFTITKSELFFTSYPVITMNFVNPYPETNDWLLTIDGSQYSVWLDSSTNVQTSGVNEAFKMASDGIRNLSIDGRLAAKVFARIQAGLGGWTTGYVITTR